MEAGEVAMLLDISTISSAAAARWYWHCRSVRL